MLGMQRLVEETEAASQLGWKALMDEERLLTRVEILESQLTTYGKSMSEDKLREVSSDWLTLTQLILTFDLLRASNSSPILIYVIRTS